MSEIRAFPVPKKSVALWWLGQTGYVFKTHEGTLLTTDMYLTNSCAAAYGHLGVDLSRRVPILIRPEELDVGGNASLDATAALSVGNTLGLAALSRGVCGTRGQSLILNLPGNPKGAVESLEAVIDLIPHALNLLQGNTSHT